MVSILDFIPVRHRNAVTREHPILNMQDGKGYFKAAENEISLVRLYRNQENRTTLHNRRKVCELDKYIKKESDEITKNQISLFDTMGG